MQRAQDAVILLVSGPSCSGKDSVVNGLLALRPEIEKVITTTTRPPRPHERDGIHYYFRTTAEFWASVQAGELLEHTELCGQYYGLTRGELNRIRGSGRVPLGIMTDDGVLSVSKLVPTVRILVTAPVEQLERRIRAERPQEQIAGRLRTIHSNFLKPSDYDLVLMNADGMLDEVIRQTVAFYDRFARPRLLSSRPVYSR